MSKKLNAYDKEFTYVKREETFSEITDQFEANSNMRRLENILQEMGFSNITPEHSIKWDPREYVKITDPSGRSLKVQAYFDGKPETIRREQSVKYFLEGLKEDVASAIYHINP